MVLFIDICLTYACRFLPQYYWTFLDFSSSQRIRFSFYFGQKFIIRFAHFFVTFFPVTVSTKIHFQFSLLLMLQARSLSTDRLRPGFLVMNVLIYILQVLKVKLLLIVLHFRFSCTTVVLKTVVLTDHHMGL